MPTEAMAKVEEAISEHWGDRCQDFDADCACCQTWSEYDRLVSAALAHPGQVREIGAAVKALERIANSEPWVLSGDDLREMAREALALPLPVQEPKRWLLEEHLQGGSIRWHTFEHECQCRARGAASEHAFTVSPLYLSPSPSIPEEKGGTAESVVATDEERLEDLRLAAASIREWMPETLPASEDGQIHFARALAESAAEAIEAFLAASPTEGQTVKEGSTDE